MSKERIKEIAEQIESDWQMAGLSDGLYYEYAEKIAEQYANEKLREVLIEILEERRTPSDSIETDIELRLIALNKHSGSDVGSGSK